MPLWYVIAAAGLFGLIIGSFLNACAYRIPRKISIARGRSMCPHCGAPIRWYDNVPLLSWVVLRARCRDCGEPISWRYPAVEGLTAVLFAAVAAVDGWTPILAPHLLFVGVLVLVSVIDIDVRIIPDIVVLPATVVGLAAMIAIDPDRWWVWVVAGLGASGALLAISLIYEKLRKVEGMGMGDVKLALYMGVSLGLAVIPALFVGFFLGAAVSIVHLARGGSAKDALPFGPFLAAGAIVGLLAGTPLIDAYLSLIHA